MRSSLVLTASILALVFASPVLADDNSDWMAASHNIRPVLTPTIDTSTPTTPQQNADPFNNSLAQQTPGQQPMPAIDDEEVAQAPEAPAPQDAPQAPDQAQQQPPMPVAPINQALMAPQLQPQPQQTPQQAAASNIAAVQAMQNAMAGGGAGAQQAEPNVPYPPSFQQQQAQQMQNSFNPSYVNNGMGYGGGGYGMSGYGLGRTNTVIVGH